MDKIAEFVLRTRVVKEPQRQEIKEVETVKPSVEEKHKEPWPKR